MIDQFSELIKLSNECCNFSELTTSMTEVDALREGVTKFNSTNISLTTDQQKILIRDTMNSLMQYIIDKSAGSLSIFGRNIIESTISINPDYLYLFEYLPRFDDSNPPKKFNEILTERLDPLSYFLFIQELFDTFSIPIDMDMYLDSLSDIIRYVLLHTKKLALTENISKLNIEILKITKKVQGSNLNIFKCLFQNCFEKSIIHKNRISKESFKGTTQRLFDASNASKQLISNEKENESTLIDLISDLIYYASYLNHDTDHIFYPYGKIQNKITEEAKTKTITLVENFGQILSNGSFTNGCYLLKITVNWEKKFKGTRLSNASFIEINYHNIKKTYEINDHKSDTENNEKKKDKNKRKNSSDFNINIENPLIEIILPSYSKSEDKVEISLVYVKEKFTDTQRKKVPPEGFGTLASFTYSIKNINEQKDTKSQPKTKSKSKSKKSTETQGSNTDNETHNDDDNQQPFVVEFKRKEKALSTKCGSISITSKYYDFEGQQIPDLFQRNPYFSKDDSGSFSDKFEVQNFLDFFVENLVNDWINGKLYRTTTTGSTSILMSIYPPQEFYIGLIEFSTRYSIPASTIYLKISKSLLKAWCHSESYLNAFAAVFLSAYVSMKNNKKRVNADFLTEEEDEMFRFIIDFLQKNVPMFLIQHLSKPALYQKHGLLPLFMLLSFVIPEEKIDSYVDNLIETSHKNIIKSVTGYLKPTKIEDDLKTGKNSPEVDNLLKYVNTSNNNEIVNYFENDDDENLNLVDVTFSINALAETMEMLNKRTKQMNKFYEDSSLPNFINQWETIQGEFCEFALLLVKMFFTIQNRNDCNDDSVFKFMFAYREIYLFFGEDEEDEEENKNELNHLEIKYDTNDFPEINEDDLNDDNNTIVVSSKRSKFEKISKDYSPFKLFFDVVLDWISRIGEIMIDRTTKAVEYDTLEIENRKMSTSPNDIFAIFRQSFEFLKSLHWDDPSIDIFIETFLGLCGSCLRNYADLLTIKMLSYFPINVIKEAKIHEIWRFINDVEKTKNDQITPRKIFVIINDFFNLKFQWNDFLTYAKSIFPSFFPEDQNKSSESNIPLSSTNSSSLLSTHSIILPPQVVDPVPNLTAISNSIPNLFSRLTSHEVTKTVFPHLWVKNSVMKQVFVKKASTFILNPEFFKTMSPIYASIYDKVVNFIKEKIDDINAAVCVKYYKKMIIAFLVGLDTGMMNLLVMHSENDEPIKHKRLGPIIDFIQAVYRDVFQYIIENSTEKIFGENEKIEDYTPFSNFMLEHVSDDPENLIQYVNKNSSNAVIYSGNENDHEFLIDLCVFIIISSQTNDKRPEVTKWINNYKSRFAGKHFYPPRKK